jgi:hypothetical protein
LSYWFRDRKIAFVINRECDFLRFLRLKNRKSLFRLGIKSLIAKNRAGDLRKKNRIASNRVGDFKKKIASHLIAGAIIKNNIFAIYNDFRD